MPRRFRNLRERPEDPADRLNPKASASRLRAASVMPPTSAAAQSPVDPAVARAVFLVVEDEVRIARKLGDILRPYGEVTLVHTLADAMVAVHSRADWTAILADLRLPDGNGLEVIAAAKRDGRRVRAMVLTGQVRPEDVNRAFDLDADFSCKPLDETRIIMFAMEAVNTLRMREVLVARTFRIWEDRYKLTAAQAVVLRARLRGVARADLPEALRMAPSTVKTHVNDLLAETRDGGLDEAIHRLLREALDGAW
jgi:DNA-binding NarL/FixJ family response regulator